MRWLLLCLSLSLLACDRDKVREEQRIEAAKKTVSYSVIVAPLIDPDKLDSLRSERAATPRLRKACFWLNEAEQEGHDPGELIDSAHESAQPRDLAREAEQKAALLRNLKILARSTLKAWRSSGEEGRQQLPEAPTLANWQRAITSSRAQSVPSWTII